MLTGIFNMFDGSGDFDSDNEDYTSILMYDQNGNLVSADELSPEQLTELMEQIYEMGLISDGEFVVFSDGMNAEDKAFLEGVKHSGSASTNTAKKHKAVITPPVEGTKLARTLEFEQYILNSIASMRKALLLVCGSEDPKLTSKYEKCVEDVCTSIRKMHREGMELLA